MAVVNPKEVEQFPSIRPSLPRQPHEARHGSDCILHLSAATAQRELAERGTLVGGAAAREAWRGGCDAVTEDGGGGGL